MTETETAPPQGSSQRWDREKIAALALLLLADADGAALTWDSLAPRAYRGMLNAEAVDDVRQAQDRPALWFDVHSQRYGKGDRAFATAAILSALDDFRDAAQAQAESSVSAMYAGNVDIGLWQQQTAAFIKNVALASTSLGVGGSGRLSGQDLSDASAALHFHLERLERFARDIENGNLNEEAAAHRAGLYPQSIVTGTFDDARRKSAMAVGMREELNVLDPNADHCQTTPELPGCADLTELGWSPIGTIPPPGMRSCKFLCRCHFVFRRSASESN